MAAPAFGARRNARVFPRLLAVVWALALVAACSVEGGMGTTMIPTGDASSASGPDGDASSGSVGGTASGSGGRGIDEPSSASGSGEDIGDSADGADGDSADDDDSGDDGDSERGEDGDSERGERIDPGMALDAETIEWEDCGDGLQCGTVEVPIDYDDPSLGTLGIAVNVHRSTDLDARVGYLFLNPGGPGVSGVELVANTQLIGFPDELTDAFDLIGFDPRGVGSSEPEFACGEGTEQFDLLVQIEYPPDTPDEIEIGNDAAELCVESMGPAGSRLSSEFVARDIDEIRKALGAEQISYLGFSYGSTLGGWYATLFPDRVYSMVVDGAENPLSDADTVEEAVELGRNTIGPLHEQFAAALASCDDPDCPIWNGGDPEAYWYAMIDKFDLLIDAKGGNNDAVVLGIVGHLYSESLWPMLHQSIYDLGEFDDPSGFIEAIDLAGTVDEASVTAHVNCLDEWALFPDDTLESILAESDALDDEVDAILDPEFPLFAPIDLPDQANACMFFEAIDPPAFEGTFDGGNIPILVVANTSDPVTPFVQSEIYANEVLGDGRLLTVEHPAHVVYPANACVNDYVHAALIDREYPDDAPSCPLEEPPGLEDLTFVPAELPDGGATVIPEGWPELAPGVWTRSLSPTDPALVFVIPTFGDGRDTIGFFESEAGGTAAQTGTFALEGVEWTEWDLATSDGLFVRFAIRPGDDGVMIAGQASPDLIDELYDLVVQPMIQSYVSPN